MRKAGQLQLCNSKFNAICCWDAAPWARATKNVKKPKNQMCDSCRKAGFKIFVKQNRNIFRFCHTFDSEVCYSTK